MVAAFARTGIDEDAASNGDAPGPQAPGAPPPAEPVPIPAPVTMPVPVPAPAPSAQGSLFAGFVPTQ